MITRDQIRDLLELEAIRAWAAAQATAGWSNNSYECPVARSISDRLKNVSVCVTPLKVEVQDHARKSGPDLIVVPTPRNIQRVIAQVDNLRSPAVTPEQFRAILDSVGGSR